MFEQHTARDIIAVAKDWGPLWTIAALLLILHIIQAVYLKRKGTKYNETDARRDQEIQTLRESKGRILTEINEMKLEHSKQMADFRVELEKRASYNWMETKIIPQMVIMQTTLTEVKTKVELIITKNGFKA